MKTYSIIAVFFFLFSGGCVYAPKQAWKPAEPAKEQDAYYNPKEYKIKKGKKIKVVKRKPAETAKPEKSKKKKKGNDKDKG